MIFVTGGAGFIGSNFIRKWFETTDESVLNIDKLTYAGNLENLRDIEKNTDRYFFAKNDICHTQVISELFKKHKPRAILNFAAESHVDRSISNPSDFIHTNIVGTYSLLQSAYQYWSDLSETEKQSFRFVHISTDEVFGSLNPDDEAFSETTAYAPNSPYSASKASSDHLVRAYFHTYGLPTIITNCSNNYGPYQYPEKLIPLVIHNCLHDKNLPIYGDGLNIRDWLYVEDHCAALIQVLKDGQTGQTYNIGGWNEKTNISIVNKICEILDQLKPRQDKKSYKHLIQFVKDRPGHDRRYAINANKIKNELGWTPAETFESGILKTVKWYIENESWVKNALSQNQKSRMG